MTDENQVAVVDIEPLEEFLQQNVCRDRLLMYQDVVQLLQENEQYTVLTAINSLLDVVNDQPTSERIDDIDAAIVRHLTALINQFDVFLTTDSIPYLHKVYKLLCILEYHEGHEFIINLCAAPGKPLDRLFELLNHYDTFEELEFFERFHMVSLSFFAKLHGIHTKLQEAERDPVDVTHHLNMKKLLLVLQEKFPRLVVFDLIRDGYLKPDISVKAITQLAGEHLDIYNQGIKNHETAKQLTYELVGLYLLHTQSSAYLLKVITESTQDIIGDDTFLADVHILLNGTIAEVLANG